MHVPSILLLLLLFHGLSCEADVVSDNGSHPQTRRRSPANNSNKLTEPTSLPEVSGPATQTHDQ